MNDAINFLKNASFNRDDPVASRNIIQEYFNRGGKLDDIIDGYSLLLYLCSISNASEAAKMVIELGADVDFQSYYGFTPIGLATANENGCDLVESLLDAGVDVNTGSGFGTSILESAITTAGCPKMVELLINRGAIVDIKNPIDYRSPLSYAIEHGMPFHIIKMIVDRTNMNNFKKISYYTDILHRACILSYCPATVELLLKYLWHQINDYGNEGLTPLECALSYKNVNASVVSVLLKYGALINKINRNGETPVDLARRVKNADIKTTILMKFDLATENIDKYQGKSYVE